MAPNDDKKQASVFIRFPTSFLTKKSTSMTFFRQRQTCKIIENPSKYKGFRIVTLFGMKAIRGSCSSAFRLKQTPVFVDFGIQKQFKSHSKSSLDSLAFFGSIWAQFWSPNAVQDGPKAAQGAPKGAQDLPKTPQRPPKTPQRPSKTPKGASEAIFQYIFMN